jgi:DnaK suppressor protein
MDTPELILQQRRRDVDSRVEYLNAGMAALRVDRAADSADDEHDPEGVTLSAEWSRLEGLREAALVERAEIDAALARVGDGTYGVCEDCGRGIPSGRLDARPTATRCVDCAARAESRR